MTDVTDIGRRQARLFGFLAISASIGLLMGLAFGALLLKGQFDHDRDRKREDERARSAVALAADSAEQARLIAERTEAAVTAATAALNLIKDCTTTGGTCKRQSEADTARAVEEIVSRINTAIARLSTVSAQSTELQRQLDGLRAEAVALRAAVEQAQRPGAPPVTVPPTPILCRLVKC